MYRTACSWWCGDKRSYTVHSPQQEMLMEARVVVVGVRRRKWDRLVFPPVWEEGDSGDGCEGIRQMPGRNFLHLEPSPSLPSLPPSPLSSPLLLSLTTKPTCLHTLVYFLRAPPKGLTLFRLLTSQTISIFCFTNNGQIQCTF